MTLEIPNLPPDRRPVGRPKSAQKTRIANGSSVPNGLDGRSGWVRRFKEIFADYLSDKPDASVAERSILSHATTLDVELERMRTTRALAKRCAGFGKSSPLAGIGRLGAPRQSGRAVAFQVASDRGLIILTDVL
jgi:hypothetical protein